MDQDMICQAPGCGHSVREHKPISATKYGLCLMAGCHCLGAELAKEEVAQATTATMLSLALAEGLIATGPGCIAPGTIVEVPNRIVRFVFLGPIPMVMR